MYSEMLTSKYRRLDLMRDAERERLATVAAFDRQSVVVRGLNWLLSALSRRETERVDVRTPACCPA